MIIKTLISDADDWCSWINSLKSNYIPSAWKHIDEPQSYPCIVCFSPFADDAKNEIPYNYVYEIDFRNITLSVESVALDAAMNELKTVLDGVK